MLCGDILKAGDPIGATTAFIADHSDPFWKYSDAAFHVQCFENWEHRKEFETKYAEAKQRIRQLVSDLEPPN